MFPLGHLGIGLLVFAPFAHVLARRNLGANVGPGLAAVLLLAVAPDLDVYTRALVHRGLTHTLLAAACVGGLTAVLWRTSGRSSLGGRAVRTRTGFLVGSLGVLGHLFGDVVTPMGIRPFLPVVRTRFTLSLVRASDPTANAALFCAGVAVFAVCHDLSRRSPQVHRDVAEESAVDASVESETDPG